MKRQSVSVSLPERFYTVEMHQRLNNVMLRGFGLDSGQLRTDIRRAELSSRALRGTKVTENTKEEAYLYLFLE